MLNPQNACMSLKVREIQECSEQYDKWKYKGKMDYELPVEAGTLSNKGTVLGYSTKCTHGCTISSKILILML
jgi:hypothetical protein